MLKHIASWDTQGGQVGNRLDDRLAPLCGAARHPALPGRNVLKVVEMSQQFS